MARGTRPRGKHIDVWVSDAELAIIDQNAKLTKLSRSHFLRNLGLGYEPKSTFDQEAIRALIAIHKDQGRLGGLLKLWLSEKPGEGTSVKNVRSLLEQIESLQQQLARKIFQESLKL